MRWSSINHLFNNFPVCCDPHKGFHVVNEAEVDVFLESPCFFLIYAYFNAYFKMRFLDCFISFHLGSKVFVNYFRSEIFFIPRGMCCFQVFILYYLNLQV